MRQFIARLLAPFGALSVAACAPALVETGPGLLSETVSLGRAIADAGPRATHILFVHGIRAEGPDTSVEFLNGMAVRLRPLGFAPDEKDKITDIPVDIGEWPKDARYAGAPIWRSQKEWAASRPFVRRHILRRADGAAVVLDEVNWWPLLFPLKCRFLLLPEARLAGADAQHLRLCAQPQQGGPPWLSAAEAEAAIAYRTPGGGGTTLNRGIKQQIFDWGLADAVIALGPARFYVRRAMQRAFTAALPFEGRSAEEQDFHVIAESLGSFAILDALRPADELPGAVDIALERSASLYFFANQIALLELARLTGIEGETRVGGAGRGVAAVEAPSPIAALASRWAGAPSPLRAGRAVPRQIIAFNDPSDMLTWRVPEIGGATVVNIHNRNATAWFGFVADPVAAHTGHRRNKAVLDVIFGSGKSR